MDVAKDLLCGSIAGGAGCFIGHPLDTVKVNMQAASESSPYSSNASSVTKLVRSMARNEGFGAFFKGLPPPMISVSIYQSVCFATFNPALRLVSSDQEGISEDTANYLELFKAGTISGIATVGVTTPTDLLKIRMQTMTMKRGSGGVAHGGTRSGVKQMLSLARAIVANEGVRGLYRGWLATLLRDSWSTGLYFVTYHKMKNMIRDIDIDRGGGGGGGGSGSGSGSGRSVKAELFAGGLAGMAAWGACLPCDVIKTRLQCRTVGTRSAGSMTKSGCREADTVTSWVKELLKIVREEGYSSLFKGGKAMVVRAAIVNSVTFWCYEECKSIVGGSN